MNRKGIPLNYLFKNRIWMINRNNHIKVISLYNIFAWFLITYIIFLLIPLGLSAASTRLQSFVVILIAGVISISYLNYEIKKITKLSFIRIALVIYFIKILVGYLFWKFYMFPNYFSNPNSQMHFAYDEYILTLHWMKEFAAYRGNNGFFSVLPFNMLLNKHTGILYFMSNLFYGVKPHTFNISVFNALFSVLSAYLVLLIMWFIKLNTKQLRFGFLLACLQPFSMISTIPSRDIIGQFFVVLSFFIVYYIIIILGQKKTRIFFLLFLILIASYLASLQRLIYLIFPVFIFFAYVFKEKSFTFKIVSFVFGLSIILLINSSLGLIEDFTRVGYNGYMGKINLLTIVFLPLNLIRNLIGPMPWTQFFKFTDTTIFQISTYFQSVINLSFWALIVYKWKFIKRDSFSVIFVLSSLLFLVSSLATIDIHTTYISIGTVFLIPVVVKFIQRKVIIYSFLMVFVFFVFLNVFLIFTGLTGQGMGRMLR